MENESQAKNLKTTKHKQLKSENKKIIEENKALKQNLNEAQQIISVINDKYDALLQASSLFEKKSTDLLTSNHFLKENLLKIINLNQ